MAGWDLFATEMVQYLVKAVVLGAIIVAAIFAGAGIRKAVNKKKENQNTASEQ
ncbi:MAG: hypothetical protein NC089_01110 [Bacteroides sp.]|nr:hypothetical protein [Bacteroides sp.]MCM1549812.1 hypothetical protein [Clostridium sp.]